MSTINERFTVIINNESFFDLTIRTSISWTSHWVGRRRKSDRTNHASVVTPQSMQCMMAISKRIFPGFLGQRERARYHLTILLFDWSETDKGASVRVAHTTTCTCADVIMWFVTTSRRLVGTALDVLPLLRIMRPACMHVYSINCRPRFIKQQTDIWADHGMSHVIGGIVG